jgi:predicted nucleic acid-binding protein/Arc/MetJ-type ribon-helix-helix transcriptional regulator
LVTNIEISGFTEEVLEALVKAGIYGSKTEAIRDAIRRLLESYDLKEISLRAYKNGGISFQLAVEISGLSMDELTWYFLSRDTTPLLGSDNASEIVSGEEQLKSRDSITFDLSSLYAVLELNALDLLSQLGKKLSISSKTMERAKALVLRLSKAKGVAYTLSSFDIVNINKSLMEFSRRNGISLQEAHSIYIAKKLNGILVSDDAKTRQVSRSYGVPAVPTLSLLSYARSQGLVNNNYFKELVMKMATIPFMVPKDFIG